MKEYPKELKEMTIKGMSEGGKESQFDLFKEQQKILMQDKHRREYRQMKKKKRLDEYLNSRAMAMMGTLQTILNAYPKVTGTEISASREAVTEMYILEQYH